MPASVLYRFTYCAIRDQTMYFTLYAAEMNRGLVPRSGRGEGRTKENKGHIERIKAAPSSDTDSEKKTGALK